MTEPQADPPVPADCEAVAADRPLKADKSLSMTTVTSPPCIRHLTAALLQALEAEIPIRGASKLYRGHNGTIYRNFTELRQTEAEAES